MQSVHRLPLMDYTDFATAARSNPGRCALLVRHGERPSLEPGDPTYGRNLPLTEAGEAMARACGRVLRGIARPEEWTFGASSLRRTMLTAQYVAEEIGCGAEAVEARAEVGIPGLWISDVGEVHKSQQAMGLKRYHDRQVREGRAAGFYDGEECAKRVLAWMAGEAFRTKAAFFATHDCHVAVLLNALGVANTDGDHWVGFLQGAAFLEGPEGLWRVGYVVPDKAAYVQPFFE